MKKVVFLGTREIGAACFEHLLQQRSALGFEVAGVLTNDERLGDEGCTVAQLAEQSNVPLIDELSDYQRMNEEVDIAISVQYYRILGRKALDKARQITVNYHMAPLPEYRGCNQFSFAIVNGETEFGTTLHKMDEGVDDGDVIAERRFAIPDSCFVDQLYQLTFQHTLTLFEETLPRLLNDQYELVAQEQLIRAGRKCSTHLRREIDDLKRIDLSWDQEKIERHLRATAMPGFPPPYFLAAGRRFEMIRQPSQDAG